MAAPELQSNHFPHQPDIADEIDLRDRLVEREPIITPDLPPSNQEFSRQDQLNQDGIVDQLIVDTLKLRDEDRKLVTEWQKFLVHKQGLWTQVPEKQLVALPTGETRELTRAQVFEMEMARTDISRQALVGRIREQIAAGNSQAVVDRIQTATDQVSHEAGRATTTAAYAEDRLRASIQSTRAAQRTFTDGMRRRRVQPQTVADAAKDARAGKKGPHAFHYEDVERALRDAPSEQHDAIRRQVQTHNRAIRPRHESLNTALDMAAYLKRAGLTYDLQRPHATSNNNEIWLNGFTYQRPGDGAEVEILPPLVDWMEGIVLEASQQRLEAVSRARQAMDEVDTALNLWELGQEDDHNVADDIDAYFEQTLGHINKLSIYDEVRADLVSQLTILHYRRAQRDILARVNTGTPLEHYPYFMTDDGGIYKRTDSGDIVIYEDGSSSRLERGDFVRRWADGELWSPEPAVDVSEFASTLTGMDNFQLQQNIAAKYDMWEAFRFPEDRAQLAVCIDELVRRTEDHLTDLAARLTSLEGDRRPDEDDASFTHRMNQANTLRLQIADRRASHNQDIYLQGMLRAEPVPAPGTPARIGFTILEYGGLVANVPPHIEAHGVVRWNNLRMNDEQGNWRIYPNGVAARITHSGRPTTQRETYYNADGTPVTP